MISGERMRKSLVFLVATAVTAAVATTQSSTVAFFSSQPASAVFDVNRTTKTDRMESKLLGPKPVKTTVISRSRTQNSVNIDSSLAGCESVVSALDDQQASHRARECYS